MHRLERSAGLCRLDPLLRRQVDQQEVDGQRIIVPAKVSVDDLLNFSDSAETTRFLLGKEAGSLQFHLVEEGLQHVPVQDCIGRRFR